MDSVQAGQRHRSLNQFHSTGPEALSRKEEVTEMLKPDWGKSQRRSE